MIGAIFFQKYIYLCVRGFVAGMIHWKEYYRHFLQAKGFAIGIIDQHMVDYRKLELSDHGKCQLNMLPVMSLIYDCSQRCQFTKWTQDYLLSVSVESAALGVDFV